MLVDGLLKISNGASQLVDLVFGPVKLQAVNADISEREEYVEHERERDRHREQRRQAPAWRRATGWLRGKPSTDDDDK